MQDATETQDGLRRLLSDGADQMRRLESLHASGVLARWEACQLAVMNYHLPHVTKTSTYWGGTMEVDIREVVSSCVFIHGVYEPELSAFLHSFLKVGQTFVDVGAHYGYFSLLAAHCVGETGHVVAIEPSERTTWRLYQNIAPHKQARFHRVAAWDREDVLTMNDYGPLYSAFNSVGERRIHESAVTVTPTPFEVRAVALDDYFQEINVVPDVIKIDAESAELQVLGGLHKTLRDVRPVVTIEVGDYSHLLEKGVPSSAQILHLIASHGYECFSPTLDGLNKHEIDDVTEYVYSNIVAIPSERVPILVP